MSAEVFRETVEAPGDGVIVALDNMDWEQAKNVIEEVGAFVGLAKANALAQKRGWEHAINEVNASGVQMMADAKYKDVPSTMENHVRENTECMPQFITIFADNTLEAMEAAVRGRDTAKSNVEADFEGTSEEELARMGGLLGVTVLTSISDEQCVSIYGDQSTPKVLQFAHTALEAGLDGVVCSGQELEAIRADKDLDALLTVVPGITPVWAAKAEDQQRIITPAEAVRRGADYIVVGRAITKPPEGVSRAEAAERIAQEIGEAA